MDTKRRALGKGLEQLFNNEILDFNTIETTIVETATPEEIVQVNLVELRSNPYQPRKHFDEDALQELSNSIKEHGVFQPIIVKKSIKGYEIVAGERRVKASKLAGLTTIPAIIKDFTDDQMMEIALLENLQRENLSAIEEAWAYKNILDALMITQEELAHRLGKSRSHVTNMIGLLRLPKDVQDMVMHDEISMGHARVLSKLEDLNQIRTLAEEVIKHNLSVRDLESKTSNDAFKKKIPTIREKKTGEYGYVETALKEKLGTKVKVTDRKIEISFSNANDLQRILEIIHIDFDD